MFGNLHRATEPRRRPMMATRQVQTRRTVLAAIAAGLFARSAAIAAEAENNSPVRIATLPIEEGAQALYAQDRGLFPRAGAAAVMTMPTGPGIVAAVASGETDIGFANLFAFVQAFARGTPIRILAPGQLFRPRDSKSFVLVVRADSPYRAAKDLNGKKVGANAPVSIVAVGARAWIDRNGGDSSTIEVVQVPFGSVAQALETGRADAVSTTYTDLAEVKNVRILGYPTEAIGSTFIGSAWYARTDWVDADRERARRYARALVEAGRWANAHQNESGQIVMKHLHLTPEGVQKLRGHRAVYAERLDPALIEPLISIAAKYAVIPKPLPARDMLANLG